MLSVAHNVLLVEQKDMLVFERIAVFFNAVEYSKKTLPIVQTYKVLLSVLIIFGVVAVQCLYHARMFYSLCKARRKRPLSTNLWHDEEIYFHALRT